jgi:hypothetical protein
VDVDAQAIKMVVVAVISIRSTKQRITIFIFFIAVTPLRMFVVKWFLRDLFYSRYCKVLQNFSGPTDHPLSKYLTFTRKGSNR